MTDCNVAIHTHGAEGENAGEHIVVIDGDHDFAENGSKGPCSHQVVDTLEGQGTGC